MPDVFDPKAESRSTQDGSPGADLAGSDRSERQRLRCLELFLLGQVDVT